VVRHAGASRVELTLQRQPGGIRLQISDNGRGLNGGVSADASGIRGMRERALLIDGQLTLAPAPMGGVLVTLDVPLHEDE
jgi:two-component system sensor histidine kinase UhpB